jgi:hypothetical protein
MEDDCVRPCPGAPLPADNWVLRFPDGSIVAFHSGRPQVWPNVKSWLDDLQGAWLLDNLTLERPH